MDRFHSCLRRAVIASLILLVVSSADAQVNDSDVRKAMHEAVGFFRQNASASGGYVYQLSADLARREGEKKVGPSTAWIEPPGTPAVGLAYLKAFQACGDDMLLDAAKATADALIRGQLESGGWDNLIEFDEQERKKYAYRVDHNSRKNLRNTTTFDDNKSQSTITFLMQLDQQLEFSDVRLHESVSYALESALRSQYPNGAWPQRYSEIVDRKDQRLQHASIPKQWSRQFPGTKYGSYYTLNDNTMSDLIVMMLDAGDIYQDARYVDSAKRGGDFLLRAQLPEPQPGWAQQYDREMCPAWARKFEPPAITGGESQGVMRTLMLLYRRTAARFKDADRFLEPIPRALAYYRRSQLKDGRLARFYELETNRPLYFTKEYQLTYSPDDMPTHYGFIVNSKIDKIESELEKIRKTPRDQLWKPKKSTLPRRTAGLEKRVEQVVANLDSRGAWAEPGRLRDHGDSDSTRSVIRSVTFIKNLQTLAEWLGSGDE